MKKIFLISAFILAGAGVFAISGVSSSSSCGCDNCVCVQCGCDDSCGESCTEACCDAECNSSCCE